MAWEGPCLLPRILLVLLASGFWAQDAELLQTLEGETITVTCQYRPHQRFKGKHWCRRTSDFRCINLVSSLSTQASGPRYSIQDHPSSNYFSVTMTKLRVKDSGVYHCFILEHPTVSILRTIHLVVSEATTPATTRRTRVTTAPASAFSPVIDSSLGNGKRAFVLAGVAVAVLLLLGLAVLVALYLRRARGRAGKGAIESVSDSETLCTTGENESSHVYEDFSGQQEKTTGFDQQIVSDEDAGTICYASLIHLNHSGGEDSIYANTHAHWKPTPDPPLSVEYTSIPANGSQPFTSPALEGEARN